MSDKETSPGPAQVGSGHTLRELVDQGPAAETLRKFSEATSLATNITSYPDGEVILHGGWRDLCALLHRGKGRIDKRCFDDYGAPNTTHAERGRWTSSRCRAGLISASTPLIIDGVHLGDLIAGQVLLSKDERDDTLRAVRAAGLNPPTLGAAVDKVPVLSPQKFDRLLALLSDIAETIIERSYQRLRTLEQDEVLRRTRDAQLHTQQNLRISEAQLRTLVDTLPDLIWLKDADGHYLACNSRFERFFGAPADEILSKTDYDFVDSDLADSFRANDLAAMRAGGPRTNEEEVVFADDAHRELLETIRTPMRDRDGQLVGVLGIARDITQREADRKDREELQAQLHQAQRMESVGRLAGGVAHDLNNLLSPILGYGELLLDELDDDQRADMDQIVMAGYRARDLVRQLLTFSRRQPLEPRATDFNTVIGGFRQLLRRTIPESIRLVVQLHRDPPPVLADVGQLEQVLMNLSVNAADAMPEGGELHLCTDALNPEAAAALGLPPQRYAVLIVRDTGCGMSTETQRHIFEPFYSTKGDLGTGLGLATVYGIVKQHGGGEVRVDSAEGEGTTMRVLLPATEDAQPAIAGSAELNSPRRGNEVILLVEDDGQVRGVTEAILRRRGYKVLVAPSPHNALQLLTRHNREVDLLLSDVVMPEMSGPELLERAHQLHPGLPTLFMSGYSHGARSLDKALELGVPLISKPFSVIDLSRQVREALDAEK